MVLPLVMAALSVSTVVMVSGCTWNSLSFCRRLPEPEPSDGQFRSEGRAPSEVLGATHPGRDEIGDLFSIQGVHFPTSSLSPRGHPVGMGSVLGGSANAAFFSPPSRRPPAEAVGECDWRLQPTPSHAGKRPRPSTAPRSRSSFRHRSPKAFLVGACRPYLVQTGWRMHWAGRGKPSR